MDGPIKTLFTVAMREEANPIIARLGLKMESGSGPQPIYKNENTALIISGIGKIKSATATTRLFLSPSVSPNAAAINFGIAGSVNPSQNQKSQIFLINKIVDAGSKREFFPDMTIDCGLAESALTTFDAPVTVQSRDIPQFGLVDMEASGFYEATSLFRGPHRIACLKIVSDHLEGKRLDRHEIRSLVESHTQAILTVADDIVALNSGEENSHTKEEIQWMDKLNEALRLTVSQTLMLKDWVLAHRLRKREPLPTLTEILTSPVKTKTERNRRFEAIRKTLAQ